MDSRTAEMRAEGPAGIDRRFLIGPTDPGFRVVELLAGGAGQDTMRLLLRPNPPLSRRGRWWLLGLLGTVTGLYALLLASRGLWPVLPFAGAELAAVAVALRLTARRARRQEVVEVDARKLRIRRDNPGRDTSVVFASGWARVRLQPGDARWHPARLEVGTHGRWVELGGFLTEAERRRAAGIIERALKPHAAW